MLLIAPLHCFYLLLFGFLSCITTSTAHTRAHTAVLYCSITELAPSLDEELTIGIAVSLVRATFEKRLLINYSSSVDIHVEVVRNGNDG